MRRTIYQRNVWHTSCILPLNCNDESRPLCCEKQMLATRTSQQFNHSVDRRVNRLGSTRSVSVQLDHQRSIRPGGLPAPPVECRYADETALTPREADGTLEARPWPLLASQLMESAACSLISRVRTRHPSPRPGFHRRLFNMEAAAPLVQSGRRPRPCGPSCVGAANPAAPSPHLRLTGSTLSDMSALRNKDKYLSSPPTK